MRVGFDTAPLSLNQAGERRYAGALLDALRAGGQVEVEELTLARREPGGMAQRVAYQAAAEAVYYPLLIGRKAKRSQVDLVHHPRHLVPRELGRAVPSVVTVHDVLPLSEPEHFSNLIRWRYGPLARAAVKGAALVLTGSEHSAAEIAKRLEVERERIRVTPYGVEGRFSPAEPDPERLERELGVPSPYVLTVGTVEPRKNLAGALRVFERVQGEFPQHSLVLAGGRGWKGGPFEQAAAATSARVVRPGYVSDDQLARLYSGADCFLYPSFGEGFGFPVLEAMACGTAVVASDRGSLPELVVDNGMLLDPLDEEGLADALAALLDSPERCAELGRRGRVRAASFSWARCARLTVDAYAEALNRG
jgi:glycosyltransferase involved in cell wall biosynthesis